MNYDLPCVHSISHNPYDDPPLPESCAIILQELPKLEKLITRLHQHADLEDDWGCAVMHLEAAQDLLIKQLRQECPNV